MPKPYSHKHRDSERFFLLEHLLSPLSLTMSLSDTDFIISSSLDNSDDASSLVTLTALFAKNVLRKRKKARVSTQDRDSFDFWQQTGPRI
jgi:hypothetical protein